MCLNLIGGTSSKLLLKRIDQNDLDRVSISDYLIQWNRLGSRLSWNRVSGCVRVYGCMCSIVACCRCLRRTGRNRIKSVVISRMDRRESKGSF